MTQVVNHKGKRLKVGPRGGGLPYEYMVVSLNGATPMYCFPYCGDPTMVRLIYYNMTLSKLFRPDSALFFYSNANTAATCSSRSQERWRLMLRLIHCNHLAAQFRTNNEQ